MLIWHAEAAVTRVRMPAVAVSAMAFVAVSAHKQGNNPRTDTKGSGCAWSPPV